MKKPYTFRLDTEHRKLLRDIAAANSRDESNMLRWLIKQEAQRLGLTSDAPPPTPAPPVSNSEHDSFDILDG